MIKFIDRDFSWLDFNDRVLEQFNREDMPLSERIKFIGIATSNLSEFISVRFSIYCNKEREEIFYNIRNRIKEQKRKIESFYQRTELCKKLADEIPEDFSKEYFMEKIYPALTPVAINEATEIPMFEEREICFLIKLSEGSDSKLCFLQIPKQLNRIQRKKDSICLIEHLIENNFDLIFGKDIVTDYIQFTTYKNFDNNLESKDGETSVEKAIKLVNSRKDNKVIFLDISRHSDTGGELIKNLTKILKTPKDQVYVTNHPVALEVLSDLKLKEDDNLIITNWVNKFKPKYPEFLNNHGSFFDQIDDGDVLLHYPYDSFAMTDFIKEAAKNPDVISIKQTLYRISGNKSPIIKALKKAAKNGIKVTVLIELFARFDERKNIKLIKGLKKAGCNIIYSPCGLKTHAKMCLITKRTKSGIKMYSQYGTGNYNEKTSKIYTDISIFTKRKDIGYQLNSVFNMIAGFNGNMQKDMDVKYSPYNIRSEIKNLIETVINRTDADNRIIMFKMNALCDDEIVNYIHDRAEENPNVQFMILCRGICTLPADLPNLKIKSIVGRFLEHSRIYATVVDDTETIYISSADLMTRNLDYRIEIMVPIHDNKLKDEIMAMMYVYWSDNANSWMLKHSEWQPAPIVKQYTNAHNEFMK